MRLLVFEKLFCKNFFCRSQHNENIIYLIKKKCGYFFQKARESYTLSIEGTEHSLRSDWCHVSSTQKYFHTTSDKIVEHDEIFSKICTFFSLKKQRTWKRTWKLTENEPGNEPENWKNIFWEKRLFFVLFFRIITPYIHEYQYMFVNYGNFTFLW